MLSQPMPFPMVKSPVGYCKRIQTKVRYAYITKTDVLITNKTHLRLQVTYLLVVVVVVVGIMNKRRNLSVK